MKGKEKKSKKGKEAGGGNADRKDTHIKVGHIEIEMLKVVFHLVASRRRKDFYIRSKGSL